LQWKTRKLLRAEASPELASPIRLRCCKTLSRNDVARELLQPDSLSLSDQFRIRVQERNCVRNPDAFEDQ
jgi:hypothetical protein